MKQIIYEDFTPGLWFRGSGNAGLRETPNNPPMTGLSDCNDCYPLPTGGLRAGPKWSNVTMTGMNNDVKVVGFQVRQAGGATANRVLRLLTEGATGNPRSMRMGLSSAGGNWNETTFVTAGENSTGFDFTQIVPYAKTSAGLVFQRDYWGFPHTYTTAYGLYSGNLSTVVTREATTLMPNYLTAHQNRLVCVESLGTFRDLIRFTAPTEDNFLPTTAGSLAVRDGSDITSLISYFPNDLFIMKRGPQSYVAQGDLGNPIVSETAQRGTGYVTWACKTPLGVAVLTRNEGIYLFGHGAQPRCLTKNFVGSPMARDFAVNNSGYFQSGSLFYYNDFLFTPYDSTSTQKFLMYDFRTGAWFRSSFPTLTGGDTWDGIHFWGVDDATGTVYGAHNSTNNKPVVMSASVTEDTNMTRASTYTFTIPILENLGRSARLRKVILHFNAQTGTNTFAVSTTPVGPNGNPATVTVAASAIGIVSFDINTEAPIVSLTVVSTSTSGGEAPGVKRVVCEVEEGTGYEGGSSR